jgi:poly[ADP-ribose] polymerase 16
MTIEDKRIWIEEKLDSIFNNTNKSDLLALDFEINLLICAAQSYKHETVLKPFPSTFLSDSNNNKNYTQLLNAIESLPPLLEWKNRIKNKKFTSDQLLLIYWILIHKNYQLFYSTTMNQVLFCLFYIWCIFNLKLNIFVKK